MKKKQRIVFPELYAFRCIKSFDYCDGSRKLGEVILFDSEDGPNGEYFERLPEYDEKGYIKYVRKD